MASTPKRLLQQLRRKGTLAATRGAIGAHRWLGVSGSRLLGTAFGTMAGMTLPLRARLARNLELALGPDKATRQIVDRYFQRLGRWTDWRLSCFNHGLVNSVVPEHFTFDDTLTHLDEAVRHGKGVILASLHNFCCEMAAGVIHRRHPMVILARENKDPYREHLKQQWYQSLGVQTVRRPRRTTALADTFACLRVLRSGKLLAITPDVVVSPERGTTTRMLGCDVTLSPGAVLLAARAKCPLVTFSTHWPAPDRMVLRFAPPAWYPAGNDWKQAVRYGFRRWCNDAESYLREYPENWMFWLDKRWTSALRSQPHRKRVA